MKQGRLVTALIVGTIFLAVLGANSVAVAAGDQSRLWQVCPAGSTAGQCFVPAGIASDPASGDIYVADLQNQRVNQFSIWGVFIKSWGWGVRTGASELQTCTTQTGCQEGLAGAGKGQLGFPSGVAVDSAGDVYVLDRTNNRIQKFDPGALPGDPAQFLWTVGGEVNKTKTEEGGSTEAQRNLCTAASGEVCQAGTTGTGAGQFGSWAPQSNPIAIGPGDTLYVGDENRIQRFDKDGAYLGSIALAGDTVQSLAVARSGPHSGDLYVTRCNPVSACVQALNIAGSKPDIWRLSPAGVLQDTLSVPDPQGVAVDPAGNVYAVDGVKLLGSSELMIHKFDPDGDELPEFPFVDGFDASVGIAASSACGIVGADFYVSNFPINESFIRAYGPPPNPTLCPPPTAPPEIEAQYPSAVDTTSATLEAQINPNFWPDATYQVQYGTGNCSAGGCPLQTPVQPLGTAVTSEPVQTGPVSLTGLAPETVYHFRFVSSSSGGGPTRGVGNVENGIEGTFTTYSEPLITLNCPNEALRAQADPNAATGLPFSRSLAGCRAYEMVSPADKNGGDISDGEIARGFTSPRKSSRDGERAAYSALRAFAEPQAAPLVNQYISTRTESGWSTQAISPPRLSNPFSPPGFTGQFKAFDEDVCRGWLVQDNGRELVPGAPVGVESIYRRDYCDPAGDYELLTPIQPPGFNAGPGELKPEFYVPNVQGTSADNAHTVFRAPGKLTNNACSTPGINQVYVTNPEGGPLRLVSALPPSKSGVATCTNSTAGTFEDSPDGFRGSSLIGAISDDAETIFWTDSLDPDTDGFLGLGPGDLYVRLRATKAASPISGGACTDPARACTAAISVGASARFWAADPQGTTAIYGIKGGSGGAGDEEDLFEYDVAADSSQLIANGVTGVAGASTDTSRIYLISTKVLSGSQQNSEGDVAQAGARNLYLRAAGGGFVFVGGVAKSDLLGDVKPSARESRVSPDGLHLVFASAARLSAYDNTDLTSGIADSEVYLYDAAPGGVGELTCVGCNPAGSRPAGRAAIGTGAASWIPGWAEQQHPSRLLAADGSRVFFNSYDPLVPRDKNSAADVYLWQRSANKEQCQALGAEYFSANAAGCISLISGGQGTQNSEVIDSGVDGRDLFFTTGVSLLPQDPAQIDVYDARVGGGFPQPIAPPPCQVDADNCRPEGQTPSSPAPTSTAPGPGNVKPKPTKPRCPKGKHRVTEKRKPKCVPNKKKKSKAKHKRAAEKNGRAAR